MPNRIVWVLSALIFVTAFYVVQTRHKHRLAYNELQALEAKNDRLVDEWGQLLTEANLWSFPHRIEKDATRNLAMRKPTSDDVVYVDLKKTDVAQASSVDAVSE